MAAGDTLEPSGTRPNRYFDDISADELSANAPTMKPMMTRTPDVNATGSKTNGADVFVNLSQSRISQRLSTKSPTECTLLPNSASCLSL
jgi:hypothetical protein